MQLIIHSFTSQENQENESSASNQGPIPHQARSPRLATPLRCHVKEIKNSLLPLSPTQTSIANGHHKVPLNIE